MKGPGFGGKRRAATALAMARNADAAPQVLDPFEGPQPLFMITCMRSYSSLVCGMLGQHPQLYALPEVNLATADGLGGMMSMFRKIRPASLHGLLRALAELEFGTQTDETIAQARDWLDARADWSTAEVFRHLARRAAPRAIIDKSPTSVALPRHLDRLLAAFPQARFLHLTRHPRPTCKSIHALIAATDAKKGTARADQTNPERLWSRMNANAFDFMDRLPVGQGLRIRGEDLLSDPDLYLRQICQWLEVRDDVAALADMKHPERSPFACFGPDQARFGNDPNYLTHPEFTQRPIAPSTLQGPQEWLAEGAEGAEGFSSGTRELAYCLGYQ